MKVEYDQATGFPARSRSYDPQGRLRRIVETTYDAEGRLLKKVENTLNTDGSVKQSLTYELEYDRLKDKARSISRTFFTKDGKKEELGVGGNSVWPFGDVSSEFDNKS